VFREKPYSNIFVVGMDVDSININCGVIHGWIFKVYRYYRLEKSLRAF